MKIRVDDNVHRDLLSAQHGQYGKLPGEYSSRTYGNLLAEASSMKGGDCVMNTVFMSNLTSAS